MSRIRQSSDRMLRVTVAVAVAAAILAACSQPAPPRQAPRARAPVRITQFYATAPNLTPGDQELLCYGVENARSVWLSPPQRELSAALTRCVDVNPARTTTYTLTAEGSDGNRVTGNLTITVGKPRAKILEVQISAREVKRGDAVSICYRVENAHLVEIQPIGYRMVAKSEGCAVDTPRQTTNYVVAAIGADGDRDQERVTITVRDKT